MNYIALVAMVFAQLPEAKPIKPNDELLAAVRDASKLDPVTASRTRYLTLYAVPEKDRDDWINSLNYWLNSISKEAEIVKARRVTATLFSINIDDYAIDPVTYEKLGDEDPFFHVRVEGSKVKTFAGGIYKKEGKYYKAGAFEPTYEPGQKATVSAPWLDTAAIGALIGYCQTGVPILRGDWFISRVSSQAGRNGTGYYDFLAVKDRDAFDKLVGLNIKESQRVKREQAAIVGRSGVGNFSRQIYRFQSITGSYWQTRDALDDNRDARNAQRQLDGDYKHQAEEIYGYLPNGLFAYFLCDDKGVRQDSAPDKIGADKTAPGNDSRIHVGISCTRCHVEGLRPIDDWARKLFGGAIKLGSPDPDKLRRLRQLYLSELQEKLEEDRIQHAKTLKRLTGWKTEDAAKKIGKTWAWYTERDLMPVDAARDIGVTEAEYIESLKAEAKKNPLFDQVLASHLAGLPIRSDAWEEVYVIAATIAGGLGAKK